MQIIQITKQNAEAFHCLMPPKIYSQLFSLGKFALGAINPDTSEACGILIFHQTMDLLELDWIYVMRRLRKKGIGEQLLTRLIDTAFDCPGLSGIFTEYPAEEKLLNLFFTKLKFESSFFKQGFYQLSISQIKAASFFQQAANSKYLFSLENSPPASIYQVNQLLNETREPLPIKLPIAWTAYQKNISMIYYSPKNAAGTLLFKEEDPFLLLAFAFSSNGTVLPNLLLGSFQEITSRFPEETELIIPVSNGISSTLIERIFPNLIQPELCRFRLDFLERSF